MCYFSHVVLGGSLTFLAKLPGISVSFLIEYNAKSICKVGEKACGGKEDGGAIASADSSFTFSSFMMLSEFSWLILQVMKKCLKQKHSILVDENYNSLSLVCKKDIILKQICM